MDKKRLVIYPILFGIILAIATQGFQNFGTEGLLIPMLVTLGYFTIFFVVAQIIRNNAIVDLGWGFAFVVGSWTTLLITGDPTILSYIVTGFITIWGVRLSARLTRRNWGKPEDFRYAQWRREWGDQTVIIAFFRVFMIQGIINFTVGSASYAIIKFNTFTFSGIEQSIVIVGLFLALTGLIFEVAGDEQLRRHIQSGKKTLMDKGVWSLTRHPNYFGEILIWTGLYVAGIVMMVSSAVSIPYYLALVVSPLIMGTVLIKISTPLLEKHMVKYDGWEAYIQKTPMIFPWGKTD